MPDPEFRDASGTRVDSDDPGRYIWASKQCTYWTDDWAKLGRTHRDEVCCPKCGAVGIRMEAGHWADAAMVYELRGHPGYCTTLLEHKEVCKPLKVLLR